MAELLVVLFGLLFLAFCLTAIALYALSRDGNDNSASGWRTMQMGSSEPPDDDQD